MTKKAVTDERLQNCVLHSDETQTFAAWWKTVDDGDDVEVQFPHERHGLAGRVSNHSKQDVLADFLEFVDANSQPNGRQAGSYIIIHSVMSTFINSSFNGSIQIMLAFFQEHCKRFRLASILYS